MAQVVSGLASTAPVTLAADRFGNLYGVNGVTRGFRYSGGTSAVTMGITTGASVRASPVTPAQYYVSDIVVTDPGESYVRLPTVSIAGVSSARATLRAGGVDGITAPWSATTHSAAPYVSITGGQASDGVIAISNLGGVAGVNVNAGLQIFASGATVYFYANSAGVTGSVTEVRPAAGRAIMSKSGSYGRLASVVVTDPGSYVVGPTFPEGASPVGATVSGGYYGWANPTLNVTFSGIASTAAISVAGTDYTSAPTITVGSRGPRRSGGGAIIQCEASAGILTSATVVQPGTGYDGKIIATLSSQPAKASATVKPLLTGRYLCAIRYADSTPESRGGPNYGSIGPTVEVDCGEGAQSILWTNLPTTSPAPSRITHLELWRTTGDQAITMYRVARYAFGSVPAEFVDSTPDDTLSTAKTTTVIDAVTALSVTDGGQDYSSTPTVTISGGGGTGATARAALTKTVKTVTVATKGSGYTSAPTVAFSGGSGGGAAATASLEYYVLSYTVTNGGSGYIIPPTVFVGGQSGKATATLSGGSVVSISVSSEYVSSTNTPPAVTFSAPIGSGAAATAIMSSGRVASVTVTTGGTDYASSPTVSFSGGGGSGATATATLMNVVKSLALTSRGSGYTSTPTVSFSGGSPSVAATATATVDQVFIQSYGTVYSLPILTEEGYPSAERFGIPPTDMAVICMFQDRAWYAVSTSRPNTICFSEVDEPESVPASYELTVQPPPTGSDYLTGLFVMDGALYAAQSRNLCRIMVTGHPLATTSASYVAQRGMLNQRCFDIHDGIAYIADSYGLYAFDGSRAEPLSDAVANYWSEPLIDFASAKWFSVNVDPQERVVRFYYRAASDNDAYPSRALCYSLVTKAWWTESYAHAMSAPMVAGSSGQQRALLGTSISNAAAIATPGGLTDAGSAIAYSIKTGNYPLNSEPKRGVRLTYTPTSSSHSLGVACYYNGSSSPRSNAIATDVGTGVTAAQGDTKAVVELSASRSSLGTSNGVAQVTLVGRLDDKSAGGDKDLSIELSGSQSTSKLVIHRMEVEGAG